MDEAGRRARPAWASGVLCPPAVAHAPGRPSGRCRDAVAHAGFRLAVSSVAQRCKANATFWHAGTARCHIGENPARAVVPMKPYVAGPAITVLSRHIQPKE